MTDLTGISLYGYNDQPKANFGFEGAEKRLEIDFKSNGGSLNGLRDVSADGWQEILNHVNCTIISNTSNEYFDSYVLSESSLFVYPFKIMIKTCGTTTLLNCIPALLELAFSKDLEVEFVMFSRKNYLFPSQQKELHRTWEIEVKALDQIFDGHAYIVGPLSADHWCLYLADYSNNGRIITPERTIEMMMHKLDPTAAAKFYRTEYVGDRDKFPGIADLIPGSQTDEFNFTPCGYSMNGLCGPAYWTIHVTPEPNCSYASFETNLSLASYTKLVSAVLDLFRPGTATITFFSEKSSGGAPAVAFSPFDLDIEGYALKHKSVSEVEGNCDVLMLNYESSDYAARPKEPKKIKLAKGFSASATAASAAIYKEHSPFAAIAY
eukprot:TRINITY_DN1866_c0_g3_i1.p1 TRINITY_DN1866_c0_g3~~TRINITY_DN1866_c0_g3_i1.p1  ORF type:complete len:379 (-),score=120.45 TRINITY_DN1866_c0_g3_i1:36-1172(-)